MSKPTVFFSHSSRDKDVLCALKAELVRKSMNAVGIFLSSDGESIRLGRNWVSEIERGLSEAKLMFVFVTPNSKQSQWLAFEAGHAYARGLDVVPVGLLGVDIGALPPPISLLQGFNGSSPARLSGIIGRVNEKFALAIPDFSPEEYARICGAGTGAAVELFSEHARAIREIKVVSIPGSIPDYACYFEARRSDVILAGHDVISPGMRICIHAQHLQAECDVRLFEVNYRELTEAAHEIIASASSEPKNGLTQAHWHWKPYLEFIFRYPLVRAESEFLHVVAASLLRDDVRLVPSSCMPLELDGLQFAIGKSVIGPSFLVRTADPETLLPRAEDVGRMLRLLFERGVLMYANAA